MAKISVVVPIENSVDKIDAMLLSVFVQSEQDTEIIFVDNASTDGTLKLIERYTLFDKRVQLVSLKQKTTVLDCCYIGTQKANARYIYFIDGTKYVDLAQGCLARLLANIEAHNSDFVYSPCLIINPLDWSFSPLYQIRTDEFVQSKIFSEQDIPYNIIFRLSLSPWGKLYNREFLLKSDFPPYEETFFLDCILRAQKITYDLFNLYFCHNNQQELVRKSAVAEELANLELLQRYGVFEKYKTAYIFHKMRVMWLNIVYAEKNNQKSHFEELKSEFADEDFSRYDLEILRKEPLYQAVCNVKNLDYDEFKKTYLGERHNG